jgi:hypothetical protein
VKCDETIVFKPGPMAGSVQDRGSGFWPGHRVSRVNPYLKKNSKRRHFSKKKVNGLQPGFDQVLPGHTGSWVFLFFFNPARFKPRVGRVPGRPAGPGQTRFQNYGWNHAFFFLIFMGYFWHKVQVSMMELGFKYKRGQRKSFQGSS